MCFGEFAYFDSFCWEFYLIGSLSEFAISFYGCKEFWDVNFFCFFIWVRVIDG